MSRHTMFKNFIMHGSGFFILDFPLSFLGSGIIFMGILQAFQPLKWHWNKQTEKHQADTFM